MRRANAPDHIGYAVVLSERDTALGADRGPAWVPFSWFEPMWLENLGFAAVGDGWCLTEAGATRLDGEIPGMAPAACCRRTRSARRGCCASPKRAAGALQRAEHQVDGVRSALGHAYGGGSQFFAMWALGSSEP